MDDAFCDVMKQNNEETEYRVHISIKLVRLHHPDCCTLNSEAVFLIDIILFHYITDGKTRISVHL